jgi:hypothetical protein
MSTQQNTSTGLNFNPGAESTYNSLVGSGGNVLSQYINNPLGNPLYQLGLGQSQKGAAQAGANNNTALQSIMKTSGMGGTAGQGFLGAQQAQMGRANASMMSQANLSNVMNAFQRQMQATGMGMSFSPQLTGSTGTSSTGGLGTWLPQLLGAGLGMAGGAMTGGASTAAGAAAGSAPSLTGGMNINQLMQGGTSPFSGGWNNPMGMTGSPNILSFMQPGQQ